VGDQFIWNGEKFRAASRASRRDVKSGLSIRVNRSSSQGGQVNYAVVEGGA